jgi:hypothetical protein
MTDRDSEWARAWRSRQQEAYPLQPILWVEVEGRRVLHAGVGAFEGSLSPPVLDLPTRLRWDADGRWTATTFFHCGGVLHIDPRSLPLPAVRVDRSPQVERCCKKCLRWVEKMATQ